MTQFKVGDIVRPKYSGWANSPGLRIEDIRTHGNEIVIYLQDLESMKFSPGELALVSPAEKTDEELATEYRDMWKVARAARDELEKRGFKLMRGGVPVTKIVSSFIDTDKFVKVMTTTKEV